MTRSMLSGLAVVLAWAALSPVTASAGDKTQIWYVKGIPDGARVGDKITLEAFVAYYDRTGHRLNLPAGYHVEFRMNMNVGKDDYVRVAAATTTGGDKVTTTWVIDKRFNPGTHGIWAVFPSQRSFNRSEADSAHGFLINRPR